eukprot:590380-Pelagomonas_calceolata.AAC.1
MARATGSTTVHRENDSALALARSAARAAAVNVKLHPVQQEQQEKCHACRAARGIGSTMLHPVEQEQQGR